MIAVSVQRGIENTTDGSIATLGLACLRALHWPVALAWLSSKTEWYLVVSIRLAWVSHSYWWRHWFYWHSL
jgi:hypothetical protein